ncbi:hypothetical protein [Deinococcus ruber]|uniref:Uncharacterized protein n=1 Tax=Deinococcus ruber TaxID=1848197 RepID=A0A918BUT9_9DEIO|nr:hypothetical protein [Deinococcus ruber]GGQ93235.1 hypothetical protein GCM10008957_01530 [Deinococcus ruber]
MTESKTTVRVAPAALPVSKSGPYLRPTVKRVGAWQRVTLVITIPIGPGSTNPIYGGNN